jgi:hypothetical protein
MEKKLIIHLGLPKTATTTMQRQYFPQVEGYLERFPRSERILGFIEAHKCFVIGDEKWPLILSEWVTGLNFSTAPVHIISDEFLSAWPNPTGLDSSLWPVQESILSYTPRRGTHPVMVFLEKLRDFLPPEVNLSTIVVLRNQSDFLGSLSAQVASSTEGTHHPKAISRLIEHQDAFIDFFHLVIDLEKVNGASNHLTLLFEDGAEPNFKQIMAWAALSPFEPTSSEYEMENVRATRDSVWKWEKSWTYRNLVITRQFHRFYSSNPTGWRRVFYPAGQALDGIVRKLALDKRLETHGLVEVSDEERAEIRAYCEPSNVLLAQHLGRDLVSLGY